MFITVTASNGETAKEVMLRKFQTSSSSTVSNFSCSKVEPLSLTHQPNFETFSPDFFLCGAFFAELPCEKLVSLTFSIEEINCSQCIFQHSNGHELLRFFDDINTDVQTRQFTYGHAATAHDNPLTAIN